ncbi:LPXTG cell wall anchor domain-containing protein [Streptomyces aquilus]|uniref:LPXTG cell wall anchor domain-containing protein n=1 Tax=Streptomyces aquilus TaxID=2548456 RepID=UPI0036940C12
MPSRSVRGAVAAALLAALVSATPAAAAESPGEHIANALRESPVYVADAYTAAVPASRQRQLTKQIASTGLPIKVVLTPLTRGDAFDGEADTLASVVHDRLGLRKFILITTDGDFTDSLNGYEWPSDTHQTGHAVAAAGFLDETRDAGLADLTSKAVELVAEGDGTRVYEEAVQDLGGSAPTASAAPQPVPRTRTWTWALPAIGLLALLALGALLLVRRRRRTEDPPCPFTHPQSVFAAARAADESALRRRAEAEVIALGEAAQAAAPAETPALQQALDAYSAAAKVLDSAHGLPDLAGVLALVTEGRDALSGTASPLPLCFFNPLHGRATRRSTWRPLGRQDSAQVATCAACTGALRHHRAPEVLTDTTGDGREVPYFEMPAESSVWAATGYGSLVRGEEDGLVRRVERGEFTQSRAKEDNR